MANDTARSILLQVAFKEAANNAATIDEVENLTGDYFNVLIGMHDKLGIEIKDRDFGRSNSAAARPVRSNGGTAASSESAAVPTVTIAGEQWQDFRNAKANGKVNERYPDFKKVDGKGSEWLVDKDGVTPTAFAKLVAKEGV